MKKIILFFAIALTVASCETNNIEGKYKKIDGSGGVFEMAFMEIKKTEKNNYLVTTLTSEEKEENVNIATKNENKLSWSDKFLPMEIVFSGNTAILKAGNGTYGQYKFEKIKGYETEKEIKNKPSKEIMNKPSIDKKFITLGSIQIGDNIKGNDNFILSDSDNNENIFEVYINKDKTTINKLEGNLKLFVSNSIVEKIEFNSGDSFMGSTSVAGTVFDAMLKERKSWIRDAMLNYNITEWDYSRKISQYVKQDFLHQYYLERIEAFGVQMGWNMSYAITSENAEIKELQGKKSNLNFGVTKEKKEVKNTNEIYGKTIEKNEFEKKTDIDIINEKIQLNFQKWSQKGEFEKKEDFFKRLKDKSKKVFNDICTREIKNKISNLNSKDWKKTILVYNPEKETFPIVLNINNTIWKGEIRYPIDKAPDFKSNWSKLNIRVDDYNWVLNKNNLFPTKVTLINLNNNFRCKFHLTLNSTSEVLCNFNELGIDNAYLKDYVFKYSNQDKILSSNNLLISEKIKSNTLKTNSIYYIINVDNLRVRISPELDSEKIENLAIGSEVEFLEKSNNQTTVTIKNIEITEYWYKVKTPSGKIGWIHGCCFDK